MTMATVVQQSKTRVIRRVSPARVTARHTRRPWVGFALTVPNSVGLLIFYLIPIGIAIGLAFYRWNVFQPAEFVGLTNLRELIRDNLFLTSLLNTIKLAVVAVPVQMSLALFIAIGLARKMRYSSLLRTLYFLPIVTSTVAAAAVFSWIFQTRFGILNTVLATVGLGRPNWLADPSLVLIPIGTVMVWQRLGFDIILFIAGLQAINRSYYEAASIDGATRWQSFRYITIPLLAPTIVLILVVETIYAFQVFDQVLIMTADTTPGGIDGSASTLSFYLYRSGFISNRFGYAAAVALAQFALILIVTSGQLFAQRKWVDQ